MDIVSVGFDRKYDLGDFLRLKDDKEICGISETFDGQFSFINIYMKEKTNAREKLSSYIADFILDGCRKALIEDSIYRNYSYLSDNEKKEIIKCAADYGLPRISSTGLQKLIYDYFSVNDKLNINGFVTFRVKELLDYADRVADEAAENFLAKREFDELVELLRYYVHRSEHSGSVNAVFTENGDFVLTDEDENPIVITDIILTERDKCDILIGLLIELSPEMIIIHHEEFADPGLLLTLKTVFEDRVCICQGCDLCRI